MYATSNKNNGRKTKLASIPAFCTPGCFRRVCLCARVCMLETPVSHGSLSNEVQGKKGKYAVCCDGCAERGCVVTDQLLILRKRREARRLKPPIARRTLSPSVSSASLPGGASRSCWFCRALRTEFWCAMVLFCSRQNMRF